jgi:hypothetical protein
MFAPAFGETVGAVLGDTVGIAVGCITGEENCEYSPDPNACTTPLVSSAATAAEFPPSVLEPQVTTLPSLLIPANADAPAVMDTNVVAV